MTTRRVTDSLFQRRVLRSRKPALVSFWAEWCGPCRMMAPALEELSDELKSRVTIFQIDIDANPRVPAVYGVRGIPTMILFKNGEPAATKVGAEPKSRIQAWLEDLTEAPAETDAIDSATSAGEIPPKRPEQIAEIRSRLVSLRGVIDQSDLDVRQKKNAIAYLYAVEALVHSPDPPWKVIIALLNSPVLTAFLNTAAILALIFSA